MPPDAPTDHRAATDATARPEGGATVLVVGPGGREHALARALAQDPLVAAVHVAPGNPGAAEVATLHAVDTLDGTAVAALATRLGADLVVVGPEAPLVAGVADAVTAAGVPCFGPSREAARLEGSKAFAKEVMAAAGVPTAEARVCRTPDEVAAALDAFGAPYVVKDDGLAAGKGVVVTSDRQEALDHAAGCEQVVVEDYLDGPEVSLFAVTDGTTVVPLQPAQDFKRIGDGDTGPNTGGMGAYTPLPWAPAGLVEEVHRDVLQPTVDEMARRGTPFRGLLYAGLALTSRGTRVVEFNARFGDPETQALMALLDSSPYVLLHAAATGRLHEVPAPVWKPGAAVAVVMASAGYPASSSSGDVVVGTETLAADPAVHVVHAGTARDAEGRLVTAGGRVLAVTAVGSDLADARAKAYEGVHHVAFPGAQWRTDIAQAAAQAAGPSAAPTADLTAAPTADPTADPTAAQEATQP
nr:phosphoribosylamine--glycine ligase [Nocardioides perillae]